MDGGDSRSTTGVPLIRLNNTLRKRRMWWVLCYVHLNTIKIRKKYHVSVRESGSRSLVNTKSITSVFFKLSKMFPLPFPCFSSAFLLLSTTVTRELHRDHPGILITWVTPTLTPCVHSFCVAKIKYGRLMAFFCKRVHIGSRVLRLKPPTFVKMKASWCAGTYDWNVCMCRRKRGHTARETIKHRAGKAKFILTTHFL